MPRGSPSPPPASGQERNVDNRASAASYQTEQHHQEILHSPRLEPTADTLSPFNPHSADGSISSSRASSIVGGTTPSTFSDSAQSESSLGGLNHVNDGVGQSTVERRMSRVYSTADDMAREQYRTSAANRRQSLAISDAQGGQAPLLHSRSLSSSSLTAAEEVLVVKKESCWKTWLRRKVPSYGWLISPGYVLANLPDDLIAGITISTVVIPQSMAYAMLAPLPPVYGLYTSVVPILIYCIFGTSRHMHTGTFAITTLLLGQAVRGLMAQEDGSHTASKDYSLANTLFHSQEPPLPPPPFGEDPADEQRFIGMILMLSFIVGLVQVIMSFLRVGGWASKHLLPDALVGGFNTAAVFHIGTSQLKHFLGLKGMPSPQGAFALLKSWMWICQNFISGTNWYTVGLGTISIIFMLFLRKVERRRKAEYELELRKKEMYMVQQRQAISAAIVRNHEEQRDQQRVLQRQHQQKGDGSAESRSRRTGGPLSPYAHSTPSSAVTSNISLRTGGHGNGVGCASEEPSVMFAPTTSRTPNETEQALTPAVVATPIVERQVYIPIPDILLAVIVMTLLTVIFSLDTPQSEGGMGIDVIGSIPKGLPKIAFPPNLITTGPEEWMTLHFVEHVLLPMVQPALLIAVIIYVMSFSIAKQFAKRYGYKVDPNQEMLALGLASMGGSIFSGYACTGSLTRTAILSQSGGRTPLASMVGVGTVTLTLICLTWCFERVPNAVLAAIVLVALQSLIMQITEPLKLWRLGQRKASLIWTVTFVGVLIVSVELGIAIGIVVVLLTTAYGWISNRNFSPRLDRDGYANTRSEAAAESLLNDSVSIDSGGGPGAVGGQRRRPYLSAGVSSESGSADWRRRLMSYKWGQRIGSFLGMERPMFTNTLHANTDDDDY
ncbi:hypothetical protein BGZ70_000906 [Mortierella alpina]|uniref:SLC26A/SulP transporter domain-containing protein n=1 Tax=Mortierella alpina TaxID=64518 RepID=A0A9P6IXB7_MORAP|nr:hypothetical protein BGZ70_000906 [Mortierella alpina]